MKKKFLPQTSLSYLRNIKKTETDPKALRRIDACIARKEGRTIQEIADELRTPYATIQYWLKRIEREGIRGRYDIKNKGAQCRLDDGQIRQLVRDIRRGPDKFGYESGLWTMPLLNRHIKKRFNVEYHDYSVWELVRRLGFRYVKPGPASYKAATPGEIKAFKKKARGKAAYWTGRGYTVMAMDATHKLIRNMPKKGWFRERNPVYKIGGRRKEKIVVTVIGAMGKDGIHHFEFYDAGNRASARDFLLRVHKKFGRVLMFMDNAGCHGKPGLEGLTREANGGLQFEFFLPYTPELNPIETEWREMKARIAGADIQTESDLITFIRRGIRRGAIPIVRMHPYLTA